MQFKIMSMPSLLTLAAFSFGLAQKQVIGYYPSWQWYDRAKLAAPVNLPYDKVTILNYAFFQPTAEGSIVGTDPWADENILKGESDWANGGYKSGTSLPDLAHKHGVKLMVSIGGWTLSDLFPAIAASAQLRAAFADNCVKLIKDYDFDGIDMDWEYPGLVDHKGTPADKTNFTLLLQAIRSSLDAHGAITGRRYLLTACMPATPVSAMEIEATKLIPLLDYFNLMTYDFYGAWDPITGHNAPVYAQEKGDPSFSVTAAFKLYRGFGIPANKINVGIAFYGRSYAGATSLYGTHSGSDQGNFSEDDGMPMYYNVMKAMQTGNWTRHWDDRVKAPYIICGASKSLVSYDDVQSVEYKAGYVMVSGAAGAIIWEITGDMMDNRETPLLNKLNAVFKTGINPSGGILASYRKAFSRRPTAGSGGGIFQITAGTRDRFVDAAGRDLPILAIDPAGRLTSPVAGRSAW